MRILRHVTASLRRLVRFVRWLAESEKLPPPPETAPPSELAAGKPPPEQAERENLPHPPPGEVPTPKPASFFSRLLSREVLEDAEPLPAPAPARTTLAWLLSREVLEDAEPLPAPPVSPRFLSWLLAPEKIEPLAAPSASSPKGFARWLLGRERLEE
ncbi:MAG: hypothetical protein HY720_08710 [Planctomycetes bacterium]|nr:hypothetical protein [Planctomycetota bacterium]